VLGTGWLALGRLVTWFLKKHHCHNRRENHSRAEKGHESPAAQDNHPMTGHDAGHKKPLGNERGVKLWIPVDLTQMPMHRSPDAAVWIPEDETI